MEWLTIEAF